MPRLVSLVLFLAWLPAASAQSFPEPLNAERPVADVIYGGAAVRQVDPRIATNGDLSLVAWQDDRELGNRAVYAARIDAAGTVLDPRGLRIRSGEGLSDVVWNGESFVVVMGTTLAFVAPDGTLTIPEPPLEPLYAFVAATPGPDVRLLYASELPGGSRLAILDGRGNVVAAKDIATSVVPWAGAGTSDGFLALTRVDSAHVVATRLDRDGNVVSSKESGLPLAEGVARIAGGSDGFLLLLSLGTLLEYRLDPDGVVAGPGRILASHASTASVVREANRYLVAWQTAANDSIAEIGLDDSLVVHPLSGIGGGMLGVALASDRGRRVLVSAADRFGSDNGADLFARILSPSLDSGEPLLVTTSATPQENVDVASGANGFAVTWGETGPDAGTHIYVRRFSASGLPQDPSPLVVFNLSSASYGPHPPAATIVSNGETYLLGWWTPGGTVIRRLSARSGVWLDPIPIPLGTSGSVRLATNGSDAIALVFGLDGRVTARRINLTGEPFTTPVNDVRTLPNEQPDGDAAIASNGTDYLAVWTETVVGASKRVYGIRLRADGTLIDAAPFELGNDIVPNDLHAVSAAGRYLVTWSTLQGVHATRVSAEGAVLDGGASGAPVLEPPTRPNDVVWAVATQIGDRFGVVFRHRFIGPGTTQPESETLTALSFEPETELDAIGGQPRAVLFRNALPGLSLSLAAHGGVVAVAYDRIEDGDAGNVGRAFLRLAFEPPPRRRASPH